MKHYLLIFTLLIVNSCKEKTVSVPRKKINDIHNEGKIDLYKPIEEIGHLYLPEKMVVKENNIKNKSENEDYQITLTNSDLLDSDLKNIEDHTNKIASLYYQFLVSNIRPLNLKKIIVKIEHKNFKINHFEYLEEDIVLLPDSR